MNEPTARQAFNAACRRDFLSFVACMAKAVLGYELEREDYVELLAAFLEEIASGAIQRGIISMPPRLGKSDIATVLFSAWLMGREHELKVMFVSHSAKLAEHLSSRARDVMTSSDYRAIFPDTSGPPELDQAGHFRLSNRSELLARSIESGVTGFGAGLMILDDPLDAGDASSAEARQKTMKLLDERFLSRAQNPATARFLLVAQRLHVEDPPALLFDRGGWERLQVGLVAETEETYRRGSFGWTRPAGHILHPSRYTDEVIAERRQNRTVFAAQYQQRPLLAGDSMLKDDHFRRYVHLPASATRRTISVDCAEGLSETSAYTVMATFASDGTDHYLVEVYRRRVRLDEMRAELLGLINRHNPRHVLIEEASLGIALINMVNAEFRDSRLPSPIKGVPRPTVSKADRLRRHLDCIINGRILVPEGKAITKPYVEELIAFEEGGSRDQVDATSQYLDHAHGIGIQSAPPVIMGIDRTGPLKPPPPAAPPRDRSPRPFHPNRNPHAPRLRFR